MAGTHSKIYQDFSPLSHLDHCWRGSSWLMYTGLERINNESEILCGVFP